MQKRIIAAAVLGLVSSAAFAQTSVTIGGKFDAGYQFKNTANVDGVCGTRGDCGGVSTETLGDGGGSWSRITVVAKEDLMPGWSAMVDLDLRFGNIDEGKTGINTNDKKAVSLTSPVGTALWGVYNVADNYYLAEKPYMIAPKDLEIVKYGISTYRFSALTSRETELRTPVINAGPVGLLFKAGYAFGDKRKDGSSNISEDQFGKDASGNTIKTVNGSQGSGDVKSVGLEYKVGAIVNGGADYFIRSTTSNVANDSFRFYKLYTSVKPVAGLKVGLVYINQMGYGTLGGKKAGFQDKITNLVVSYNLDNRFEFGGQISKVRDVGENRNSGRGWMIGGAYMLSKTTYVYAARQKSDWESNVKSVFGGKYDGAAANFSTTANKLDETYTRVGIVKEF